MMIWTNLYTLKVATLLRCTPFVPVALAPHSSPIEAYTQNDREECFRYIFLVYHHKISAANSEHGHVVLSLMGTTGAWTEGVCEERKRRLDLHIFLFNFHFIWRKISIYHQRVLLSTFSSSFIVLAPLALTCCLFTRNYVENMLKILSDAYDLIKNFHSGE